MFPLPAVTNIRTDNSYILLVLRPATLHYTDHNMFYCSSGIEDNPTIFYQLIRGSTDQTNKYDTFYLQQRQENGWTYADVKVNQPLDFERIKEYNLTIRVEVNIKLWTSLMKYSLENFTFIKCIFSPEQRSTAAGQ